MNKIEIAEYKIISEKIPKDFDDYVILHMSDLQIGRASCRERVLRLV